MSGTARTRKGAAEPALSGCGAASVSGRITITKKEKDDMNALIREMLPDKRYRHSINVAKRAAELAIRFGEDPDRAEYAGLAHDICKKMSESEQLDWIAKGGIHPDEIMLSMPQLYHAAAGCGFLRSSLGIGDEEILSAVRYHTTGRAGMSRLEMIVYLADLTSEDRGFPDIGHVREIVNRDLREGMMYALARTISDMVRSSRPVCEDTFRAYNDFCLQKSRIAGGRGA